MQQLLLHCCIGHVMRQEQCMLYKAAIMSYCLCNVPDDINHLQTHLNTTDSMVWTIVIQTRDTVVAVSENFDAHTVMLLHV